MVVRTAVAILSYLLASHGTAPRIPAVYGAPLFISEVPVPDPVPQASADTARSEQDSSERVDNKTGDAETTTQTTPAGDEAETTPAGDEGVDNQSPSQDAVPPSISPFPVIIFSHGLGGCRATYSGTCCDLASHGYVVAAVEHRYMMMMLPTIFYHTIRPLL